MKINPSIYCFFTASGLVIYLLNHAVDKALLAIKSYFNCGQFLQTPEQMEEQSMDSTIKHL